MEHKNHSILEGNKYGYLFYEIKDLTKYIRNISAKEYESQVTI